MNAPASLNALLAELRSNSRLRWGLWVIVAILWLYGVLLLRDEVPRQLETYRAVSRQLARTEAAASDLQWNARREQALGAQAQAEARMWRASTLGLAQASFHDFLTRAAQQAALQRPQIAVAAQESEASRESLPGLWKATARVTFEFSPQTFYPFMASLSAHDKHVVVESMTVRTTPSPRADLVLVAYFLGATPGTSADAPGAGKAS